MRALAVMPGGDLIACGVFTLAGGAPASNIARWNGSAWSALGTGTNGEVRALAYMNVGTGFLVVGGAFSNAGGNAYQNVASWSGTSWASLFTSAFSGGTNGPVNALAVTPDGVIASGAFTATDFGSAPSGVASWQSAGFGLGTIQASDAVSSLAVLPDGKVLAAGNFANSSDSIRGMVARWNGTSWSSLARGTTREVFALQSFGDGDVAVGGRFTSVVPGTGPDRPSLYYAEWLAGDGSDADGDGHDDICDNCAYASNASQVDVGGLGIASTADGIGDACQCGDVTGDGRLSNADVAAIRSGLRANPSGVLAPDRCSVNGAVDAGILATGMRGDCDVSDASLVRRALLALTPLPAQVCEAAVP